MGEYKPGGLSIPIAHFIAADQPVSTRVLDDPRQGWSEWARGGLEARLVRGDHFSMFAPENAAELAAGVERALPTVARASACGAGG
jgi:thioesterase domain-containing protein